MGLPQAFSMNQQSVDEEGGAIWDARKDPQHRALPELWFSDKVVWRSAHLYVPCRLSCEHRRKPFGERSD
jgi:hypothetical protein